MGLFDSVCVNFACRLTIKYRRPGASGYLKHASGTHELSRPAKEAGTEGFGICRVTFTEVKGVVSVTYKMKTTSLLMLALAAWSVSAAETATDKPAPHWSGIATNSLGKTVATITFESQEVPELAAWGKQAGQLCAAWYPRICDLLASEGFTPPNSVQLHFRKDMKGVAATGGNVIDIAADYVKGHTNDYGMVIHELTHVVQSYPPGGPGWLVEGIADYIRLSHFEPQVPVPRIDPDRASYRDAYKTTAAFLAWIEKNHDRQIVKKLNRALREKTFREELFSEFTGRNVNELWHGFTQSLRKQ